MVVCPIRAILYEEEDVVVIKEGDDVGPLTKRMWDALTDIQVPHSSSLPTAFLPTERLVESCEFAYFSPLSSRPLHPMSFPYISSP